MVTLLFLNKAGMGPLFWLFPSPWGRLGWGLWLMVRTPGNSVGVAITKPRVEVRSASTLGINIIRCSYSIRVAISRRRYHSRNSSLCYYAYMTLPIDNQVIIFLYRRSRTFFTAKGGLFVFAAFQPATRQARMGVAGNIRELALEIFTDTHRRIGRSPEKPQNFL